MRTRSRRITRFSKNTYIVETDDGAEEYTENVAR